MGLLKTKSSLGLKLADVAWSSAVLAPLVVTYWRGTWDLLDDLVSEKFKIFQGSGGSHLFLLARYIRTLPRSRAQMTAAPAPGTDS